MVDKQNHPDQKSWQNDWDSAWVPQNCGMVKSGREENCIQSPEQIRILGICHGWDQLDSAVKCLPGLNQVEKETMTPNEWDIVDELRKKFGSGWMDQEGSLGNKNNNKDIKFMKKTITFNW